jgi:capsular exopolysaccharide synthesis family protein
MIEGRKTRIIDLQEVLTQLQPQIATVVGEVEVLRSRTIAKRVADKLDLYNAPDFNPTLKVATASRFSTIGAFLGEIRRAVFSGAAEPPLSAEAKDRLMRAAVVDKVLGGMSVSPVPQSLVIRIEYRSADPERAAQLANAYAEAYIEEQLDAKFETVRHASTWLNERLGTLRTAVAESERAVNDYRSAKGLVDAKGGQLTSQQRLSELSSQLVVAKSKRAEYEARVSRMEAMLRSERTPEALDEVLASPLIQRLKEQEATLSREVTELASRYGDRHPLLVKGKTELADLRAKIKGEVETQMRSMRNELSVLREREQGLAAELKSLEGTVLSQDKEEIRLRELEREAQANRTLYETFLARFKETGEQEQIQQADVRIISTAEVPRRPSYPRRPTVFLAAAILGTLVGTALVLLLEHLDSNIRTRDQLEDSLGLRALGMIPQITAGDQGRPEDYLLQSPSSAFAEAFRMLWNTLKHADEDRPPRIVVVTSSLPDEGKSMTALSLARTVASLGQRVLLVDGDIRRSTIYKKMALKPENGLSDVLLGRSELKDVILRDPKSSLDVLPSVPAKHKEVNLLASSTVIGHVLAQLREEYDLVVIDSPPTLPVADVQVLAKLADQVLFCVRWDKTPRQTALAAIHMLQDVKADIAGVLLTRVHMRKHAGYGYQDVGYYYARYRSYYAD